MLPVVITGSSVPGFSKNWDRLKIGLMSLDDATGVVAEEIGKPESERDQRFLDLAETYFPGIEQQVREQPASQGALA